MPDMERLAGLKNIAAVAGVGESDYAADYRRTKDGVVPTDGYGYAAIAFKRALADAGLTRADIDGLIVGPTLPYERTSEVLGISPRWAAQADAGLSVVQAVMAIHAGLAETVALVYGYNQRSGGVNYGGPGAYGASTILSYGYYAPWGLTSQGALYALMARRYFHVTGMTERELGLVSVSQRQWSSLHPGAVMRQQITIEEYLASRYITEPLHLYDYCLINDGGVALIITTRERAKRLKQPPVLISGIGRHDLNREATALKPRLVDFYHTGHKNVASQVYGMAGVAPGEIDAVQIYDSFSLHIPVALEGFGLAPEGVIPFLRSMSHAPGGRLPVNTSGGHLSETYMQGWNHQVEAVRQLRGQGGERQVPDCRHVQYIGDAVGKVLSLIYSREGV